MFIIVLLYTIINIISLCSLLYYCIKYVYYGIVVYNNKQNKVYVYYCIIL